MEKKSQNGTGKKSSNQNKKKIIFKSKWKRNIRQNEKIVYL